MRPSDRAWLALAAAVVVYDLCAGDGEQLSEAVDRYLVSWPWLTRAVAVATTAHLLNLMPHQVDPLHHAAAWRAGPQRARRATNRPEPGNR